MLNLKLPTVETERLILRPIELCDASDMYEYASDDYTLEFLLFPKHETIKTTKKVIKDFFLSREKTNLPEAYAVVLKGTNKMIGTVDIHEVRHTSCGEIGYVLNKDYVGNGYMTEAVNKFIEICFKYIGLHRIELLHAVDNIKSERVAIKCGFKYEGTLSKLLRDRNGVLKDHKLHAMLKEDYLINKEF